MNNETATVTLSYEDWQIIQYAMSVAIRNGMDGDLPKQVSIKLNLELHNLLERSEHYHRIWMSLYESDKVKV